MIETIHIQNFKSIKDLEINLGRINLIIGENGSGKSNLLESLVFVSAGEDNKLDNNSLFTRGIRVPKPTLMSSSFDNKGSYESIVIRYYYNEKEYAHAYTNKNEEYSPWELLTDLAINMPNLKKDKKGDYIITPEQLKEIQNINFQKDQQNRNFKNFLIYSAENTSLRKFEVEGQIEPLGINGEGLLKLLTVINNYEDRSYIETIIESLQLFNWFEDIKIPKNVSATLDKIIIKDKYLYQEIDQRSANEGFLFILFYITLIVAKETPKAFAIDNIDASLNPKLCTKLMTLIVDLAKKYDKQIFLTTHNPAILDGINLNDEQQKLFVASRNKKGHTRMREITINDKPQMENGEDLNLSVAFLRGYLGGLPKGF